MRPTSHVLAVALLFAGGFVGLAIPSCKEDKPATLPAVTAPAYVKGPTREEVLARDTTGTNIDDYEKIKYFGMPVAYKTPDGETWQKYSNNLMIQHLKVGSGRTPVEGMSVKVAYKGSFPGTGKVFDSTTKDKPFEFVLGKKNSVIKGWTLAVSTMKPGGKAKVFIPPELAYGPQGMLPTIPPNAALVFEIELLDIQGFGVSFPPEAADAPSTQELQALTQPKTIGPELPATAPAK